MKCKCEKKVVREYVTRNNRFYVVRCAACLKPFSDKLRDKPVLKESTNVLNS
jgi:hypothetical protein